MGTVLLTHYALKTIPLFILVNRSICLTESPFTLSVRRELSRSSFQEKYNVFAIVCQENRPPDTLLHTSQSINLHRRNDIENRFVSFRRNLPFCQKVHTTIYPVDE